MSLFKLFQFKRLDCLPQLAPEEGVSHCFCELNKNENYRRVWSMSNLKSISGPRQIFLVFLHYNTAMEVSSFWEGLYVQTILVPQLMNFLVVNQLSRTMAALFWRTCSWPISVSLFLSMTPQCVSIVNSGMVRQLCSVSLACRDKRCRIPLSFQSFHWSLYWLCQCSRTKT